MHDRWFPVQTQQSTCVQFWKTAAHNLVIIPTITHTKCMIGGFPFKRSKVLGTVWHPNIHVKYCLIKRILTKFKRYSNVISTSLSRKTLHCNSAGGSTTSFICSSTAIIIYYPFVLQNILLCSLNLRWYLWKFVCCINLFLKSLPLNTT